MATYPLFYPPELCSPNILEALYKGPKGIRRLSPLRLIKVGRKYTRGQLGRRLGRMGVSNPEETAGRIFDYFQGFSRAELVIRNGQHTYNLYVNRDFFGQPVVRTFRDRS